MGPLRRDANHAASTTAPVTTTIMAAKNHRSTSARSAASSGMVYATTSRAGVALPAYGTLISATTPSFGAGPLSIPRCARNDGGRWNDTLSGVMSETITPSSRAKRSRNALSTVIPPTRSNRLFARKTESTRASARNEPAGARARTSAATFADVSARTVSGSSRSNSLRKCPELTIRPSSLCSCSIESPAVRIACSAQSSTYARSPPPPTAASRKRSSVRNDRARLSSRDAISVLSRAMSCSTTVASP